MPNFVHSRRLLVGATAMLLVLSGCASNDATVSDSSTTAAASSDYAAALKYLDAKQGAADSGKTPVTLGWVNEQGGTISSPEATAGAEAAVSLINAKLGGIDGHPLKLSTCFVASSEEEGQKCAQQFHNDASVTAVLTGATGLSSPALHAVLSGQKPVVGSAPSAPVDASAKWSYYIGNGVFGAPGTLANYAIKNLSAKKIALIGPAFIGTTVAIQAVQALAKAAGATLTTGTYPQGSSDVTPAVVASKASSADAVIVLDNTSTGCIAVAKALKQLNVADHVASLNTCAQDDVKKALGDLPQWNYLAPLRLPVATATDPSGEVKDYLASMATYQASSTVQASAGPSFALVLYVARLMNRLGADAVTAATLNQALTESSGPVFMGAETLKFGGPPFPAIGSLQNLVYGYSGKGVWAPQNDGKYL